MTARDEAIKAAASAIMATVDLSWDQCDDVVRGYWLLYATAAVDALAVPVLLNDLADRIEAETAQWKHTVSEDCWYTCPAATEGRDGGECCNDAMGTECDCGRDSRAKRVTSLVRAAAEGWGATNG